MDPDRRIQIVVGCSHDGRSGRTCGQSANIDAFWINRIVDAATMRRTWLRRSTSAPSTSETPPVRGWGRRAHRGRELAISNCRCSARW
jgi:hypothetical protein